LDTVVTTVPVEAKQTNLLSSDNSDDDDDDDDNDNNGKSHD
jgi:hypothetical protein